MASSLDSFSTELQLRIIESCDRATNANLCLVSKSVGRLARSVLYHTIDLSVHHAAQFSTFAEGGGLEQIQCPLNFVNRFRTALDDEIWHRQQLLLRTLSLTPQRAERTRELTWTVLESRPQAEGTLWDTKSSDDTEAFPDDKLLWQAFKSMSNLRKADISWQRTFRETTACVPRLFSSVSSVSIGGIASRQFVAAILQGLDSQNLRTLELNNLQQMAEPIPPPSKALGLTELSAYCEEISDSTLSGIMRGHFDHLLGKLPALRTLIIRTWSQEMEYEQYRDLSVPHTAKAYADWACLIRSVASSLEVLHFEQGPEPFDPEPKQTCRGTFRMPSRGRPMDILFADHIVPAILESEWPRLRSIRLLGFSGCDGEVLSLIPRARPAKRYLEAQDLPGLLTRHLGHGVETTLLPDNGSVFEYFEETGVMGLGVHRS